MYRQKGLAVASIARDVAVEMTPPLFPACTATKMRGKFRSEFETQISYNASMHFRHRQTDTDIVA